MLFKVGGYKFVNLPESLPVVDISLRIFYKFRNKEHLQKATFHEIIY